jgi:hypothetical protein
MTGGSVGGADAGSESRVVAATRVGRSRALTNGTRRGEIPGEAKTRIRKASHMEMTAGRLWSTLAIKNLMRPLRGVTPSFQLHRQPSAHGS